jgi:hypothetical protein
VTLSVRRPVLALAALAVLLAACSSSAPTATPGQPSPEPVSTPGTTPIATPSPTTEPDHGNVDNGYPELSVQLGDAYVISITDPNARAWRFDVRGLGILAEDRLEVIVEVSDIEPAAEARIYTRGALVDRFNMNGMVGNETVAAGGCHPTLQVCFGSDGLTLDPETGRATLILERIEPGNFAVQGATADWPGEPFILGPWRTTEPFTTN